MDISSLSLNSAIIKSSGVGVVIDLSSDTLVHDGDLVGEDFVDHIQNLVFFVSS